MFYFHKIYLGVGLDRAHKEVILGFACGAPFNIELVNHHLDFTRGGHKCPLTKLVIGIFARVTEIIVLMDACYLCC